MLFETLHPLLAASLGFTRRNRAALLPSSADWPELIERVDQHRLIPLLHQYLLQTGLFSSLPDSAQRDLRGRIAEIAARQLSITHALTAILKRCAAEAIPCAPLRGPALAKLLDLSMTVRAMDDIDLLVPKPSLGSLAKLLADLGYRQIEQRPGFAQKFSYATSFVMMTPAPQCIDVHWTLAYPPYHDQIDIEGVWRRAEQRDFDGVAGWSISPPDLVIHLCAHWLHKGGRGPLLWLVELDRFIRHNQDPDWSFVRQLAHSSGQWPIVRKTLAELRNLFETPLPADWLDLSSVPLPGTSALPAALVDASFSNGPPEEWAQLVSLPALSAKVRYVVSLLWPSPEYMRWRYAVCNPMALVWAYLRRPVMLAWSVGRWWIARCFASSPRLSSHFIQFK